MTAQRWPILLGFVLAVVLSAGCSSQDKAADGDPDPTDGDMEYRTDGDGEKHMEDDIEANNDGELNTDGDTETDGDGEGEWSDCDAVLGGYIYGPKEAADSTAFVALYTTRYDIDPQGLRPIALSIEGNIPPSEVMRDHTKFKVQLSCLQPGTYYVEGGIDLNKDGQFIPEDGEFGQTLSEPFSLAENELRTDLRIFVNYESPELGSITGDIVIEPDFADLDYSIVVFDHAIDTENPPEDKPFTNGRMLEAAKSSRGLAYKVSNLPDGAYYLYAISDTCKFIEDQQAVTWYALDDNPISIDSAAVKDRSGKDFKLDQKNLLCPHMMQGRLCGEIVTPLAYSSIAGRYVMLFDQELVDGLPALDILDLENIDDNADGSISFPFCFNYLGAGNYWVLIGFDLDRNGYVEAGKGETAFYGAPPLIVNENQLSDLEPHFFDWAKDGMGSISGLVTISESYPVSAGYSYLAALFDGYPLPGMQPASWRSCRILNPAQPQELGFEIINLESGSWYLVMVAEVCLGPGLGPNEYRIIYPYDSNPIIVDNGNLDHTGTDMDISGMGLDCPLDGDMDGDSDGEAPLECPGSPTGNDLGVGKSCTVAGGECMAVNTICALDVDPTAPAICVILNCSAQEDCGTDADCYDVDNGMMVCLPTDCAPLQTDRNKWVRRPHAPAAD